MSTGFFFHKNSHIRIISWLWGHRTFRWAAMTNPPKGSPLWHLEIPKEEHLPAHEDEEAHVVHCFFSCLSYSQFASLHNPFGPKPWRCTKSADLRSAVSPGEKSVKSLGIEAPDLWWWTLLPITFTRIVELRKVAVAIICGLLKKAPKHLEKKRWGVFLLFFGWGGKIWTKNGEISCDFWDVLQIVWPSGCLHLWILLLQMQILPSLEMFRRCTCLEIHSNLNRSSQAFSINTC